MKKEMLLIRATKYVIANIRDFSLQVFWFIYIPAFIYVEKRPVSSFHEVYCFLDDIIPFVPVFVLGYYAWFGIFLVSFIYTYKNDLTEYRKQCVTVFGGFVVFIIISLLYPNIQLLRPTADMLSGNDIFTGMCAAIYSTDTPTNVMPSMHVYQAIVCTIAMTRTAKIKKSPRFKALLWIACAIISASTVFIKQHSAMDLIGAILLSVVFYNIAYVLIPKLKTATA